MHFFAIFLYDQISKMPEEEMSSLSNGLSGHPSIAEEEAVFPAFRAPGNVYRFYW